MESKVYVTGTGRSGTTFLMVLFTYLGLDTGYTPDTIQIYKSCSAGMERNYSDVPYIIKDPNIILKIDEIVREFNIDHVFIPVRDYDDAAVSRVNLRGGPGGLWHAGNFEEQRLFYFKIMAEYLFFMTKYDIPTTFISFERMVSSPEYLYDKLGFVLGGVGFDEFKVAYDSASVLSRRKESGPKT
jgi:hypothetical protein